MTRARVYSQSGLGGGGGANALANLSLAILEPFLTTANVRETSNLYFSNGRVFANLNLASINDLYDVVTRDGSGNSTANVGSGLVWTGNVWAPGTVSANLSSFTTDALPEGSNNLYYTNARARTAFTAGNPYIEIDWNLGTISANLVAVAAGANTTDTIPEGVNNLYYRDSRVHANLKLASIFDLNDVLNAGDIYPSGHPKQSNTIPSLATGDKLIWYASAGKWVPESGVGGVADYANVAEIANTVLQLGNFTTDDLVEGANNKYLGNAGIISFLANLSIDNLGDVDTTGKANGYVLTWDGFKWAALVANNAPNVQVAANAERANVANVALSAVYANFAERANVANSASVAELSNIANVALRAVFAETANTVVFAGNASIANVATFALLAGTANTVLNFGNLTTSNLAEGTNLYFTNERVYGNIANLSINVFTDVDAPTPNVGEVLMWVGPGRWIANVLPTQTLSALFAERSNIANIVLSLSNFTTSNLAEGVNLYYSNTRLRNDLPNETPGLDLQINNLTVTSEFSVGGNLVQLNVANVVTESRTITLAYGAGNAPAAEGAGILIDGANASIRYSQTDDNIGINKNFVVHGNILPAISGVFNLGLPGRNWRNAYFGTQTIFIGNTSISEGPNGGLEINDQFGNPATILIANVTSYATVTVEQDGYIGSNTQLIQTGEVGNLYVGILKDADYNKFAGMRVEELVDPASAPDVRSDVSFYVDWEGRTNSIARLTLQGNGNVEFRANIIRNNEKVIIDEDGNYVGNSYIGKHDVAITHGGTGANTHEQALRNLFEQISPGFISKYIDGKLISISLVQGTGVTIANAEGQGNVVISIGQPVGVDDSVTFRNVSISNNLIVYGDVTTYGANNISVSDNMIYLNNNSNVSNPDLGIAWNYNDGNYQHGGIFRDASDDRIKFFRGYTQEPDANIFIDTDDPSFKLANVQFNTSFGNLVGYVFGFVSSLGNHTTDNLNEGTVNRYFTNARVIDVVEEYFTTANLTESGDALFYTNARVVSAVTPLLTTANVRESSSNLYYTNARVIATVTPLLTTANVAETSNGLYYTNDRVITAVTPLLTTSNVVEGSNLYFTNARVLSALTTSDVLANSLTLAGQLFANGLVIRNINVSDTALSGGAFSGNTIVVDVITSNTWNRLYTSNVIETAGNLYFTNDRAITAITPLLTTSNVIETAGNVYFTNTRVISVVTPLLTTSNVNEGSNLYFTNARVVTVVTPLLTTSNVNEGSNLYFTNARVVTVVTPILTTANVVESTNLYFTNARVLAALATSNVQVNNLTVWGDLLVQGNTVTLSTATLSVEDKNIVLANGATSAATADGAGITIDGAQANITYQSTGDKFVINKNLDVTGNLTIGSGTTSNVSGVNQLFTQTIVTDSITSNSWNRLFTSNVIETTNLYFTNARVISVVTPLLTTSNVNEGSNLYYTNARVVQTVTPLLTTSNVNEGSNLYFTNARVVTVVTPLLTTSNVSEGSNLYYTNARVFAALSGANLDITNVRVRGDLTIDGNIIYTNPPVPTTKVITGVDQQIDTHELLKFSTGIYRSVKFVYTINTTQYFPGGPQYASGEMLVMHNGSNAYVTQYAMLTSTNDDLVLITTEINNGNVRIVGQSTGPNTNATVRLAGITYTEV